MYICNLIISLNPWFSLCIFVPITYSPRHWQSHQFITFLSCRSWRQNAHMMPCSQSYFKVKCASPESSAVIRLALAGLLGCSLSNWPPTRLPTTPPYHSLPSSSLPPDLCSYITLNWTGRRQLANANRGSTIIHVTQPLMWICLLMMAFRANRICLIAILYMSTTWPCCLVSLDITLLDRLGSSTYGVSFKWPKKKIVNWGWLQHAWSWPLTLWINNWWKWYYLFSLCVLCLMCVLCILKKHAFLYMHIYSYTYMVMTHKNRFCPTSREMWF